MKMIRHLSLPASCLLGAAVLIGFLGITRADEPAVPTQGFAPEHYEILWTKSPFAVASAEAAMDSPDYSLVGVAEFDGIPYASLIDKQSQEHFLISGDKPVRGLTLVSITRGKTASDTFALVQKGGQSLTLKLETPADAPAVATMPAAYAAPQISMPGMAPGLQLGGVRMPGITPPGATFRRRTIRIPPQPGQAYRARPAQPPPTSP